MRRAGWEPVVRSMGKWLATLVALGGLVLSGLALLTGSPAAVLAYAAPTVLFCVGLGLLAGFGDYLQTVARHAQFGDFDMESGASALSNSLLEAVRFVRQLERQLRSDVAEMNKIRTEIEDLKAEAPVLSIVEGRWARITGQTPTARTLRTVGGALLTIIITLRRAEIAVAMIYFGGGNGGAVAPPPPPTCEPVNLNCQTAQPGDWVIPAHTLQLPGGIEGLALLAVFVAALALAAVARNR